MPSSSPCNPARFSYQLHKIPSAKTTPLDCAPQTPGGFYGPQSLRGCPARSPQAQVVRGSHRLQRASEQRVGSQLRGILVADHRAMMRGCSVKFRARCSCQINPCEARNPRIGCLCMQPYAPQPLFSTQFRKSLQESGPAAFGRPAARADEGSDHRLILGLFVVV